MEKIAISGNRGTGIRSDSYIELEITRAGGVQIDLTSKVEVMFGSSIRRLAEDILSFFGINNAKIRIEDSGALEFVIAARIEAAVKQLIKTNKEYLLPFIDENKYQTSKERNRYSRLYLPGNNPVLMINAGIHKPSGIILDLEDAVAPDKKYEARFLVRNALRSLNFYGVERMVRINQLPAGFEDLSYIVSHNVNLILLPKCEIATQLEELNTRINEIKEQNKIDHHIWIMPIIESAKGVVNVEEIAQGQNVAAVAIGLEDYTADLGTRRSEEGSESLYARTKLVVACKTAGLQAIDSVYSDVADMEGLKENVIRSKSLGFNGMGCIHPRQIKVIHDYFAPDQAEIEKAKDIYLAFLEAEEKGLGVVSLGTKMIDAPVVKRAKNTINTAIALGKLSKEWREE